MSDLAWLDGELLPRERARIAPDDLGFSSGLAVFETLFWRDGSYGFLTEHLERMRSGAGALRILWPPPHDPRAALFEFGRALGRAPRAVRATLTRGPLGGRPTLCLLARPVERPPAEGVELTVARQRLVPPLSTAEGELKSTQRMVHALAREEARAAGAWDALLPTRDGDLAEATIANLFARFGRELVTPALSRGCLAGVTRAALMAIVAEAAPEPLVGPVREGRLEPSDLARADEVLLTSTTAGVIGVRGVRGLARGLPGSAGPAARALGALLWQREEASRRRREDSAVPPAGRAD